MTRPLSRIVATMTIVTMAVSISAAEKKIDLSKLPPAVRATVETEIKNATIKSIS